MSSKAKGASPGGGDRIVSLNPDRRRPLTSPLPPAPGALSCDSSRPVPVPDITLTLSCSLVLGGQNSELFTLTYGALVRHLLLDLESPEEVNKQLDKMGQNIGIRLVDDFLAKTNTGRCRNFREAAKTIAETGFRMFLGCSAKVTQIDDKECKMVRCESPF